jgi:uncharacterized Zn finger protein (UPF0148 family)
VSNESCPECDGYQTVIVDGEEVHCTTCSLRAEVERLRAEVERVEGQRKLRADLAYLMKSEKDDALAEVMRLRTAGDALAEVVDDWPEMVAAWQEARRD